MLDRLRARRRGRVVEHFRTHKTGALLAYLAYHPEQDHPREVLIELLWPGTNPESGRNNLSRELSALRGAIEPPEPPDPPVILADRHAVRLDPAAISTDVIVFESALARAESAWASDERAACIDEAASAYGGELLPGYFQDWVQPERERLVELYVRALHELTGLARAGGDLRRAQDLARRAVAADPLREESYRALMLLYAEAGEPAVALRVFRSLAATLAEALDLEPAPVTARLARDIERGAALRPLDRTPPVRDLAPSHPVRGAGLELPAPRAGSARVLRPAVGLPPRLDAGGGRGGL